MDTEIEQSFSQQPPKPPSDPSLAYLRRYLKKLQENNITIQEYGSPLLKYQEIGGSALEDYKCYRVQFGYVKMELHGYRVDLGQLEKEFGSYLYQVNGREYQIWPTHRKFVLEDMHKAAIHKILRVLLSSTSNIVNNKQGNGNKFDLVWDTNHDNLFLPAISIVIDIPEGQGEKQGKTMFEVQQKYNSLFWEIEQRLSQIVHFLSIYAISSTLTFTVSRQPEPPEHSHRYKLYITWQTYNKFYLTKPQSQPLENLLNPYAHLLQVNVETGVYYCATAKCAMLPQGRLGAGLVDLELGVLARGYLECVWAGVGDLYRRGSALVRGNKGLLINLLATLYYSLEPNQYKVYRDLMLKGSGLIKQPEPHPSKSPEISPTSPKKTLKLPYPHPKTKLKQKSKQKQKQKQESRQKQRQQQKSNLKQASTNINYNLSEPDHDRDFSKSPRKQEEFSGVGSEEEEALSSEEARQIKKDAEFSSQQDNEIIFSHLKNKNTVNGRTNSNSLLGEEYEFLLADQERKCVKGGHRLQPKPPPEPPQPQTPKPPLLINNPADIQNYSLYQQLKLANQSHPTTLQQLRTQTQISSYLLHQPIPTVLKFIQLYSIHCGELPDQNIFECPSEHFCMSFVGVWLGKMSGRVLGILGLVYGGMGEDLEAAWREDQVVREKQIEVSKLDMQRLIEMYKKYYKQRPNNQPQSQPQPQPQPQRQSQPQSKPQSKPTTNPKPQPQPQSQEPQEPQEQQTKEQQLHKYRNELLRYSWHLFNQILMLNFRFAFQQACLPSYKELEILYGRLRKSSKDEVSRAKEMLTEINFKIGEEQDGDKVKFKFQSDIQQQRLILYSLETVGSNLLTTLAISIHKRPYGQIHPSFQACLENFTNNLSYIQLLTKHKLIESQTLIRLLGSYFSTIKLLMIEQKLMLTFYFQLHEKYNQILDSQLVLQLCEALACLDLLNGRQILRIVEDCWRNDVERSREVFLGLGLLKAVSNFFMARLGGSSNSIRVPGNEKLFENWVSNIEINKYSLKWMQRNNYIVGDSFRPFNTRILCHFQIIQRVFKNPEYFLALLQVQNEQPRKPESDSQKFESILDPLKSLCSPTHPDNLTNFDNNLSTMSYLLTLSTGNPKFLEYKPQLEQLVLQLLQTGIEHRLEDMISCVYFVLRVVRKLGRVREIVGVVLAALKGMLGVVGGLGLGQGQGEGGGFGEVQGDYERVVGENELENDEDYLKMVTDFYNLYSSPARKLLLHSYLRASLLSAYLINTNTYLTQFLKNLPEIQPHLKQTYQTLAKLDLAACQMECINLRVLCKWEQREDGEGGGDGCLGSGIGNGIGNGIGIGIGRNSIEQEMRIVRKFCMRRGNQKYFPFVLSVLDRLVAEDCGEWVGLLQQIYQHSITIKNNRENFLNRYIHKLKESYIDSLLDRPMRTSKSRYLIAIEYLRHRKPDQKSREKYRRLLENVCVEILRQRDRDFSREKEQYLAALLHYITAEIASLGQFRQARLHYKKLSFYYKCPYLYSNRLIPTPNPYHKLHRLCEKHGYGDDSLHLHGSYGRNSRKLYKSLCSKCYHVVNKEIRPKRVLLFLINRIRRYEQLLDFERL